MNTSELGSSEKQLTCSYDEISTLLEACENCYRLLDNEVTQDTHNPTSSSHAVNGNKAQCSELVFNKVIGIGNKSELTGNDFHSVSSPCRCKEIETQNETLTIRIKELDVQLNNCRIELTNQQRINSDEKLIQDDLKRRLREREKTCLEHQNELAKNKRTIEQLEQRISENEKQTKDKTDLISMLEQQLELFKEDFESERKDRERAKNSLLDCEQRLAVAISKLEQYEKRSDLSAAVSQRRETALAFHHETALLQSRAATARSETEGGRGLAAAAKREIDGGRSLVGPAAGLYRTDNSPHSMAASTNYDEKSYALSYTPTAISRLVCDETDGYANDDDDCHFKEGDHYKDGDLFEDGGEERSENDLLRCPRCALKFTVDLHHELLDHIEACGN